MTKVHSENCDIRVFVIVYIANVKLRPHVTTYHTVADLPTSKRPIQLFAFLLAPLLGTPPVRVFGDNIINDSARTPRPLRHILAAEKGVFSSAGREKMA